MSPWIIFCVQSREQSSGLNVTQIQFGYTKNNELINETNSMFPMYPYPAYDGNLTDVIETKFAELTTGTVPNKTEEGPGHTSEGTFKGHYLSENCVN